jgi:hypothetical protein
MDKRDWIIGLQHFGDEPAGAGEPGAVEPGGAGAGEEPAGGAGDEDADFKGWWASQLPKEARDRHRENLLALREKRLSDVFDDYFTARERLSGAISFPGKDAPPEEVEAFLKKMDIPLKAEDYGLDAGKLPAEWDKEARAGAARAVAEACKKNGLTMKQAGAVYDLYARNEKDGIAARKGRIKEMADTVDARLAEACGDEKVTAETKEYFKRALTALNDKAFVREMKESGTIYSAGFIRALADLWKAGNAEPPLLGGGKGAGGEPGDGLPKGEEFSRRYGGKRT